MQKNKANTHLNAVFNKDNIDYGGTSTRNLQSELDELKNVEETFRSTTIPFCIYFIN